MIIRRPTRILVEIAIAIVLLCGLFFVAWCLRPTPNITDPAALRDRLAAAGLGCTGYAPAQVEDLPPDTYRAAHCKVIAEDTFIVALPDEEHLFPLEARAIDRGCTGANALATKRLVFVVGDGWVIQPETDPTARAIQSALGGRVEALTCVQ